MSLVNHIPCFSDKSVCCINYANEFYTTSHIAKTESVYYSIVRKGDTNGQVVEP